METGTITQIVTVGGTLGGALIAGIVTLISQHITKKSENEKLKKQLLFKIVEEELKEKKEIIKPLIQFINAINLPSDFSFYDDGDKLDYVMVHHQSSIKDKASGFLLDYTLYITQEIHDAIWSVTNAINNLQELEAHLYNSSLSIAENEELLLQQCSDKPSKIWEALITLKGLLYKEININEKL